MINANGQPAFNNQKGMEWVNLLLEFDEVGPTDFATNQDLDTFKQNKTGWIIEGTWSLQDLYETIGSDQLEVDPWPSYNDGFLSGYVRPDIAYLNHRLQGNQKYTAWKFIEHMTSPLSQTALAEVWNIPSLSSTDVSALTNGKIIAQTMKAMEKGVPYPIQPEFEIYPSTLDPVLKQIFSGSTTPEDGLNQAAEEIQTKLSQLEPTTPSP